MTCKRLIHRGAKQNTRTVTNFAMKTSIEVWSDATDSKTELDSTSHFGHSTKATTALLEKRFPNLPLFGRPYEGNRDVLHGSASLVVLCVRFCASLEEQTNRIEFTRHCSKMQ